MSAARKSSAVELKERLDAVRDGAPFLVLRDGDGVQRIFGLGPGGDLINVGRGPDNEVVLDWDQEVSGLHAQLVRAGGAWMAVDDGLSRNGTWVNGARLSGRRRLRDGDMLLIGRTSVAFHDPASGAVSATVMRPDTGPVPELSTTQLQLLAVMARPFARRDPFATPPTNAEVAEELHLSVDAVKGHLRVLFRKFGVEDLPQHRKRTRLIERAVELGLVSASGDS